MGLREMPLLTLMHDVPIWIMAVVITVAAEIFSVA